MATLRSHEPPTTLSDGPCILVSAAQATRLSVGRAGANLPHHPTYRRAASSLYFRPGRYSLSVPGWRTLAPLPAARIPRYKPRTPTAFPTAAPSHVPFPSTCRRLRIPARLAGGTPPCRHDAATPATPRDANGFLHLHRTAFVDATVSGVTTSRRTVARFALEPRCSTIEQGRRFGVLAPGLRFCRPAPQLQLYARVHGVAPPSYAVSRLYHSRRIHSPTGIGTPPAGARLRTRRPCCRPPPHRAFRL